MSQVTPTAQEIVRSSGSNLAFAFACLPRQKGADMTIFYAFCRIVDDIADDPEPSVETRRQQLAEWTALIQQERLPDSTVEIEVCDLLDRYPIKRELMLEIIRGVEMDLTIRRYATYAELETYCYRVASAVGLVSIEIFGYQSEATPQYAIELGHALQITNILRDVGEDLTNDQRIYLPQEDMDRFGVTEESLIQGEHSPQFLELMQFEADRAEARYAEAVRLLPKEDRGNLRASELMRTVYYAILKKMRSDGFRVLGKRYRLTSLEKLLLLSRTLITG